MTHEIYKALRTALQKCGYSVCSDALPPDGTPYPVIYIGEMEEDEKQLKAGVAGTARITLHVWHNKPGDRQPIQKIVRDIRAETLWIQKDLPQVMRVSFSTRYLHDNTTKTPLSHVVIEAEYLF